MKKEEKKVTKKKVAKKSNMKKDPVKAAFMEACNERRMKAGIKEMAYSKEEIEAYK